MLPRGRSQRKPNQGGDIHLGLKENKTTFCEKDQDVLYPSAKW